MNPIFKFEAKQYERYMRWNCAFDEAQLNASKTNSLVYWKLIDEIFCFSCNNDFKQHFILVNACIRTNGYTDMRLR